MSDRAVILAGGLGTRLRPYTVVLPKPLMPVGEYPILEIVIRKLRSHGFRRVTLAVNHQAELIRAFFGDGQRWDIQIDYSLEDMPLGTVGPLALIPDLPDNFLLMNGDILTDLDLRAFYDSHVKSGVLFTIAAARRSHRSEYGVLFEDPAHRLVGFAEKPVSEHLVSMGIYSVSRSVVGKIPLRKKYGFDDLMKQLLDEGAQVNIYPHGGYWKDIGRHDDYAEAVEDFSGELRSALLP